LLTRYADSSGPFAARVGGEHQSVGQRDLRQRRIAEPLRPQQLAGLRRQRDQRAALGVEDDASSS
jgi:hypothetical protein